MPDRDPVYEIAIARQALQLASEGLERAQSLLEVDKQSVKPRADRKEQRQSGRHAGTTGVENSDDGQT